MGEFTPRHLNVAPVELVVPGDAGGGRIEIRGFGSFSLRFRPAQVARNPRIGTPDLLPARHVPCFKPGKELRECVNREYREPPEAQRHAGGSEDPQVRSGP